MKVTVKVELDDGTEFSVPTEISSSDNPRFWTQGMEFGVQELLKGLKIMMEARYGIAPHMGVHVVR